MTKHSPPRIFGIRHHGPGSARSLLTALNEYQPDLVLVEGPPDANDLIPWFGHKDLVPPVALLVYARDEPKYAAYYPFARFSPEYQAIQYALAHGIPVQFMDLPQKHQLQLAKIAKEESEKQQAETDDAEQATSEDGDLTEDAASAAASSDDPDAGAAETPTEQQQQLRLDPLGELAKAAGYQDGERWWDHMVETRQDSTGIFEALLEAIGALRDAGLAGHYPNEDLREAYMRRLIHQAQREGYERIAVVCGAWHGPALADMPTQAHDNDLLKGLPRMNKIEATMTPWTHSRLTMLSGYGAGIWSPGWYQHVWDHPQDTAVRWLTRVAHLLRAEDLDASPAQVIDAVRLADTLAAMRERPAPGLEELNEASLTVFCFGNDAPMRLIYDKLIVGETIGSVPDETPMVPLASDLAAEKKRLRLRDNPETTELTLDLRETLSLERSHLLHRLEILEVHWGQKVALDEDRVRGTFKEVWRLRWRPELAIQVIEKAVWGNTVLDAASDYAMHAAKATHDLPALTSLVNDVLLADLPDAVSGVTHRLQVLASATGDIKQLMHALPALVDVLAYGNVRQTDADMVQQVVDGMVTRTCIGLPSECAALDDEAAEAMFAAVLAFHSALRLLADADYQASWQRALRQMMTQQSVHGLLRGRATRILFDAGVLNTEETTQQVRLAMSAGNEPAQAAAWLQGFLFGSGLLLLYNDELLRIVDEWVVGLSGDGFEALLPLLRRTFSSFTEPERRDLGRRIRGGEEQPTDDAMPEIDETRASKVLPILAELLGVPYPPNGD